MPYKERDVVIRGSKQIGQGRLEYGEFALQLGPTYQVIISNRIGIVSFNSIDDYVRWDKIPETWRDDFAGKTVLEVGPGFGQLFSTLVTEGISTVAGIDPLNYGLMEFLFTTAIKRLSLDDEQQALFETLIERAQLMQSTEVTLYNMTLREAIERHGNELQGQFDYVIDVAAASMYEPDPDGLFVPWVENEFLRK